jgi:hypothetical protein
MILTLSNFIDAHPSPKDASKTVPPKVTGSDGNSYALTRAVFDVVKDNLGSPLDVDVKTEIKGAFTNRSITAARVPATGPESPTSTPPVQERTVTAALPQPSSSWQSNDAVRQRLIVKQSSLRAAIDLLAAKSETNVLTDGDVRTALRVADTFVDWVFKGEVYGLSENHEGGSHPGVTTTAPTTPAAKALETARQVQRDIRAGYNLEDAVCPKCGRREFLGPRAAFCKRAAGGCGWPHDEDEKEAISYGEWLDRQAATNLRRPDAPLVSPTSHPTR